MGLAETTWNEVRVEPFDREVQQFMAERQVPGGALAVVKDGRLVYARGYGWADREREIAARPDSLFRIASISKPITAVAVLQLVEQGRLSLDEAAFPRLVLQPAGDATPDARLQTITVRQLLQHTGGWDRDQSYDPMFRCRIIADAVGGGCPPGPEAVIRYMLGQPLDFDPGTRYAYSNFGYCVLGRLIEDASGLSYEEYVRQKVLTPLGISRMRIGESLEERRAEREVCYYTPDGTAAESVFPEPTDEVPEPYGSFYLEAMDAHGGWIASAVDLARFAAAFATPDACPLLRPETIREMFAPPPAPAWRAEDGSLKDSYYALGWMVRPKGDAGENAWHAGSLPGTATLLVRQWDGMSWAVLFNQRSSTDREIDPAMHRAAATVTEWPADDLFASFP